jgi:hypothetical protein
LAQLRRFDVPSAEDRNLVVVGQFVQPINRTDVAGMTLLFRRLLRSQARTRSTPLLALAAVATAVAVAAAGCDGSSPRQPAAVSPSSPPVAGARTPAPAASAPRPSSPAPIAVPAATARNLTASTQQAQSRSLRSRPPAPDPAAVPATSTAARPAASITGPVATTSTVPAKAASDYKIFTNTDGTVVRWNPCAPIHFAVNATEASDPVGAERDVRAAVDRLATATGLTFVYDGRTTAVPSKVWLDAGAPVSSALVIAWAGPGTAIGHSDLFGTDADGEGGWWESGTSTDGVHWVWQIKRGFVVIDPTSSGGYVPGFGAGETRGVLLMHELGHAVGLGHVGNRRDVMFPVITSASHAAWGAGDLAGLTRVGRGAGCIS